MMIKRMGYYLVLMGLCLALFLPGITTLPMLDRDSANFAQATKQMVIAHNYLQIKFQDSPRHLKPPGMYWLQAASLNLFHPQYITAAWPYRLPSALGGMFAVLFLFGLVCSLANESVAFIAASLLASSLLFIIEAHLETTDSTLLFTILVMQGALLKCYLAQRQSQPLRWLGWPLLFWLAMAAGILIKGIAPLFAGLTLVGLCVVNRDIRWMKILGPIRGLLLVSGLTAAWLIPLDHASSSNFFLDMWRQDAIPKLMGGQEHHGLPPGFFLVTLLLTFWPGSLFLLQGIRYGWNQRKTELIKFLTAWIIPAWLVFEIIPTKLPEYLLPIYPALALLIALALHQKFFCSDKKQKVFYVCWCLVGILILSVIIYFPHHVMGHLVITSITIAGVIMLLLIVSMLLIKYGKYKLIILAHLSAMILTMGLWFQWLLPSLSNIWISNKIVASLNEHFIPISDTQPLLTLGYQEPSLVFLLGARRVIFTIHSTDAELAIHLFLKKHGQAVIVDNRYLPLILGQAQQEKLALNIYDTFRGYNYVLGRWEQLTLLTTLSTQCGIPKNFLSTPNSNYCRLGH